MLLNTISWRIQDFQNSNRFQREIVTHLFDCELRKQHGNAFKKRTFYWWTYEYLMKLLHLYTIQFEVHTKIIRIFIVRWKEFFVFFFIRKNARNLWQNHKNNKNIRIDTNTYAFTMENWFNQFIRLFPSFYWLTWLNLAIISKFVCLSNSLWTNRDFFSLFNWRFRSYRQLMWEKKQFPRAFELRICKPKTNVNLSLFLCCGFFVHTSKAPVVVHHVVYSYTHFFHLWQNSHWLVHNVPFAPSQFSTNSQFSTKCPQFHQAVCMQFKQIWMWHCEYQKLLLFIKVWKFANSEKLDWIANEIRISHEDIGK